MSPAAKAALHRPVHSESHLVFFVAWIVILTGEFAQYGARGLKCFQYQWAGNVIQRNIV